MPRAPGGCHNGRVLVKTSYQSEEDVSFFVESLVVDSSCADTQGGDDYWAEVHDGGQVEDIFDGGLGMVLRWWFEQGAMFGHGEKLERIRRSTSKVLARL